MTQEFARESTGTIIAGDADAPKVFHVTKETLEKSPVIRGWIEDPESMPQSLQKDGALYLNSCKPDVVFTLIRYLERDGTTQTSSDDDFTNEATILQFHEQDPLFYFRVYKLAGSLAVESLCILALRKIKACKYSTETFIKIAIESERGKLIEGERFRDWMIAYVTQNFETLSESKLLQSTIKEGGQTSWIICSVLMSCLSHLGAETSSTRTRQRSHTARSTSNPFPKPASRVFTKRDASYNFSHSLLSGLSPDTKNSSSSFSASNQKSPTSKTSSYRVDKKYEKKKRNLNATVEDALPSEGEDFM